MKSKETYQQIIIGIIIWVVGSALWGFLSSTFHIPQFNWSYIGSTAMFVFSILLFSVIIPFLQQSMALYFRRKQFEQEKEEQEWRNTQVSAKYPQEVR